MKKVIVSLCMAGALIALSSCRSSKDAATLSSINGEWNIIEINGAAVVPAPNQEFPFIGFDTNTGKVFGNSGCNRMMGSFDVNAKPGTIDLGAMASTRMACPDMTLEQNVLSALGQVKKYKKLGKENIALCGSSNRPIIVLQKKAPTVKLSDLSGKWIISEAGGQSIPEGMEKQPFIEFNLSEKRIHGNAGCNLINGGFVADNENASIFVKQSRNELRDFRKPFFALVCYRVPLKYLRVFLYDIRFYDIFASDNRMRDRLKTRLSCRA